MKNLKHKNISIHKNSIAYCHIPENKSNNIPGIVFLCGFMSDMEGEKAKFLRNKCINQGREFLSFDYSGHGMSTGDFEEGNISLWLNEALFLIKKLTHGPQILVGSSMGGWIALLVAKSIPDKIFSVIGIAAAPDFTVNLWNNVLTENQKLELSQFGKISLNSEYSEKKYVFTKNLFDDATSHKILGESNINISCPIRLIQGTKDNSVNSDTPLKIMNSLSSNDIELVFIKDANHRLSEPENLIRIWNEIKNLELT